MPDDDKNSIHDSGLPRPEPPEPLNAQEYFETPEQAAEQDSDEQSKVVTSHHPANFDPPKNSKWQSLKSHWQRLSKKKKILFGIIAVILVLIVAGAITFALTRQPKPAPKPLQKLTLTVQPAKPTTVPSTLTGLPVAPAVNQRQVTGVMIENSDPARPQSGLDQAGVVFEAIAEGGITRFLALYQDTQPNYLGPVRSLRPYYLQWCLGFDCDIAHVGGSPQALYYVQAWHAKNLDQSYYSDYYERITARYAPHNVYTSIAQLNALESKLGFTKPPSYSGFPRKADAPSKTPNASTINFNISGPDYAVKYTYNPTANNYTRYEGGAVHIEVNRTGRQVPITPKVVIGIVMQYSLESDDYHSQYNVIGSGKAYVFQDGTVTTGTWSKSTKYAQIKFLNASGQPIKLDAGQTWITALSSADEVSYK